MDEIEFLQVQLEPETKERLRVLASNARRSMSAHIRYLIDRDWERTSANPTALHPADLNPGMPIDCNPT